MTPRGAWEILGEHFDRALIVVEWDCADDKGSAKEVRWTGGYLFAVGAAEFAKYKLLHDKPEESED